MLAKDPAARPTAEAVYRALLPSLPGQSPRRGRPAAGRRREAATRYVPFRQPLLGPAALTRSVRLPTAKAAARRLVPGPPARSPRRRRAGCALTFRCFLTTSTRPRRSACSKRGWAAPSPVPSWSCRCGARLPPRCSIGGQYSRAAQLFEQAGAAYRQYLGAADPWALDCAYQAGHAYAQAGKPDKALPQLRYYVLNARPAVARDADEAAKVMESRFVIAQLLASTGEIESAIAELHAVRPTARRRLRAGLGAGPQPRQAGRPASARESRDLTESVACRWRRGGDVFQPRPALY